ncbi:hypothetical protein BCR34DRAFT_583837 [Clohesyomyces aquaticus]|uniref:XPG-I domain-containing protein n=1 Tax=Clohesyomyces aquaticus TaxID=1231657 RepID=A0A1Y2A3Z2_9PLEO|nr:hypothetical protein BCR34DRAFT_583837 [Clohesyomyces aquaticus]
MWQGEAVLGLTCVAFPAFPRRNGQGDVELTNARGVRISATVPPVALRESLSFFIPISILYPEIAAMNFVDSQPRSFLDYAWTTPSPAPGSIAKSSKTSRKQNRCCDQCRKGKRACDAAILEDTLLDNNGSSGDSPTVFHYSDVFGPLSACSNCEKTKKTCTFEWLRSQRILQATPQPNTAPPAKRRRKSSPSNKNQTRAESAGQLRAEAAPHSSALTETSFGGGGDCVTAKSSSSLEFGQATFADFPGVIPSFDMSLISPFFASKTSQESCNDIGSGLSDCIGQLPKVVEDASVDRDSGQGSSVGSLSEGTQESPDGESPSHVGPGSTGQFDDPSKPSDLMVRIPRKRRRRSSSNTDSPREALLPSLSIANQFILSSNNSFLTEGLLKIYHDSFENALSCWLTERTCPYSKNLEVTTTNDSGPDWNRIYHRVFKLDRLASGIRGRHLTFAEDKAASRAINAAIFSFATQWAQSSQRSKAKYPFHSDGSDKTGGVFSATDEPSPTREFDRSLQISAWHEARLALQSAAEIESFRVVLAQIVFSLTQKPADESRNGETKSKKQNNDLENSSPPPIINREAPDQSGDTDLNDCEDLLSKLNLTIDGEGPPIHLEQGLRLIHSLRSKMAMSGNANDATHSIITKARCSKRKNLNALDAADRGTVDLLFWLGIMLDTLSSAMHKRPLVVSDEDSDIYSNEPKSTENGANEDMTSETGNGQERNAEGLWDDYLFARQRKRLQASCVRWPCSYDQAASLLCDAAPVKVLLFRKVTRIQTLLSRNVRGQRMERAIDAALQVYKHWEQLYAPFIRDCTEKHDSLPPRVQSWYICLTGHWHLATLLLADLVEIIDNSEMSCASSRQERVSTNFVATFREANCHALSDLAKCACPREDASFPNSREFHFAVNQGALLTEPWTAVLIRAFAKAGVILLETEESLGSDISSAQFQKDAFRRADDCVKALWYLGRKSDMALAAAKILGDALRQRRKGVEEKVNEMSSFLEAELWEGFEEMNGGFGVDTSLAFQPMYPDLGLPLALEPIRCRNPRRVRGCHYPETKLLGRCAPRDPARQQAPRWASQSMRSTAQPMEYQHSVPLAKLAEEHYEKHGRPLRVAIDEASWRFNNLTQQQVYIIRDKSGEPAFQGIEKQMFYRLCRVLRLNIHLIFVFDGPGRPWKRGCRGGGKIDYEKRRLLQELCRYLKIPYHEAPSEAEAECARMQTLGVVDAVWSEDSDTLMFGCDLFISDDRLAKEKGNTDRSKENTKKSGSSVKIVRRADIESALGLDREALVLFAMLCGGDYDMQGLPKCGPRMAMRAIAAGLGTGLCRCRTQADCDSWREELIDAINHFPRAQQVHVPFGYPSIKTLNKYNLPKVSSDDALRSLRGLRNGWTHPIDEAKLLELTSTRFNIWGRLYMNWVAPILLVKHFVAQDETSPRRNSHQIKLTKQRTRKGDELDPPSLERKLTFSPFGVSVLGEKDFTGDNEGKWAGVRTEPFDPNYRVESELPIYWLKRALPPDDFDPPPTAPKKTPSKRKQPVDSEEGAVAGRQQPPAKRKKKPPASGRSADAHDARTADSSSISSPREAKATHLPTPSRPSINNVWSLSEAGRVVIAPLLDSDDENEDGHRPRHSKSSDYPSRPNTSKPRRVAGRRTPPAATGPPLARGSGPEIIDLGSGSEESDDDSEFPPIEPVRTSIEEVHRPGEVAIDEDISWGDWEEDPDSLFVAQDSPIRMGVKATPPPTLSAAPPPGSIRHATPNSKKTSAATGTIDSIDLTSDSQEWSFPSPVAASNTSPLPLAIRIPRVEPGRSTKQITPSKTKRRNPQPTVASIIARNQHKLTDVAYTSPMELADVRVRKTRVGVCAHIEKPRGENYHVDSREDKSSRGDLMIGVEGPPRTEHEFDAPQSRFPSAMMAFSGTVSRYYLAAVAFVKL